MTSAFEPVLNEMLANIQKQRDELMRVQREIPEISGSARSKRRQVSATVDARGEVVELKFHGTGYKSLAPVELANIIIDTIRDARAEAQQHFRQFVGEAFPDEAGFADLLDGDLDWTDSLSLPKPLLDLLHNPPEPPPGESVTDLLGVLVSAMDPAGNPGGAGGAEQGEGVADRPDDVAADGAGSGQAGAGGAADAGGAGGAGGADGPGGAGGAGGAGRVREGE